jgi:hypothetical protein
LVCRLKRVSLLAADFRNLTDHPAYPNKEYGKGITPLMIIAVLYRQIDQLLRFVKFLSKIVTQVIDYGSFAKRLQFFSKISAL